MVIEFFCSGCGRRLFADENDAGQDVRCEQCEAVTRVPPARTEPHRPDDPYASPNALSREDKEVTRAAAAQRLKAPPTCLLVAPTLGALAALFGLISALMFEPVALVPDPEIPPWVQEILEELQRQNFGPLAAMISLAFVALNLGIIIGAVKMMNLRSHGWGLAAGILGLINFGNFCCLLTLPFGIWTIVVLSNPDVKAAFEP